METGEAPLKNLSEVRTAAKEAWDALVQLRQWARSGTWLLPHDPQRPPTSLFIHWLENCDESFLRWTSILEKARDAVPVVPLRLVRLGDNVQRNALSMLLVRLEDVRDFLAEKRAAKVDASPIYCEMLETKLKGDWEVLWYELENDLDLIGAASSGPDRHQENWMPMARAVEQAQTAGFQINLSTLKKSATKWGVTIRPRPPTQKGNHKQEVEYNSLLIALALQQGGPHKPSAAVNDTTPNEPSDAERAKIETLKQKEKECKKRGRSPD
jgi:hypothetical protein